MAETGTDAAAAAFSAEINPQQSPTRAQPRRDNGQFESTAQPIERMFEPREVEGDEFGDIRDGGDDRRVTRRAESNGEELPDDGTNGEEDRVEDEPEGEGEPPEESDDESHEDDGEEGESYEVIVDGEPKQVKLKEALAGYIRTETFHQRMNKVNEAATALSAEVQKTAQMRDTWLKRNADLEQELTAILPKEPNWDEEFARDPKAARLLQTQYEAVKTKLSEFRGARTKIEQEKTAEAAANTKAFAENEFTKFIVNNKIPDKKTLEKEISSMRQTLLSAGFNEVEIAGVFDSRMLTIARKASKYDRIVAAKPRAVNPSRGQTLTPGSGNGGGSRAAIQTGRKGIDAAQKQLAKTGSLDDAAAFFKAALR